MKKDYIFESRHGLVTAKLTANLATLDDQDIEPRFLLTLEMFGKTGGLATVQIDDGKEVEFKTLRLSAWTVLAGDFGSLFKQVADAV